MSGASYLLNTSKLTDIQEHLESCDNNFIPPLSSKINIKDYSKKLFQHAERYEAWDRHLLIGLVAMYVSPKNTGFITNVSLLKDYQGAGIANKLVTNCINSAVEKKIGLIELEVNLNNYVALNLYSKLGFVRHSEKDSQNIILSKSLKGKE